MTIATQLKALSAEQLAAYHRDGYYVARGLFSKAEVDEIRDTFMAEGANGPVKNLSDFKPSADGTVSTDPLARYPRMMHPHRHPDKAVGPLSQRYMLDARVGAILTDLFEDEPIAAQTMFYFKPPGARGQSLHQDNFYLRVKPGTCMAAWVAVDDADEENGTLVVVPGSHTGEIVCPEQADLTKSFTSEHVAVPTGLQEVALNLKAGDVLFFNGGIIHGSYPNTSATRFRRAFISHYVPQACAEVSQYYRPLLRFNGEVVEKEKATGGGPCGAMQEAKGPH